MNKSTKLWKIIYKKIDDVFDEEYKVEASAKKKEGKEERRKKVEEKKDEEKEEEMSKNKVCRTHKYHLLALLIPSYLLKQ